MNKNMTCAILGGGIGGLTLAVALQRRGFNVKVFESAPQWKPLGAGLGLAGNAVKAFMEIGIGEDVLKKGKVIRRAVIKNQKGTALMTTDSEAISKRYGVVNNFAIHRADLHEVLLSKIQPGTVELGKACIGFEQHRDGVTLIFKDGARMNVGCLIAADGIHSVVRKQLLPDSVTRYAGYTCWRGVTSELPPGFDQDETSETWGYGARFGIVPLTNNRVYWFACLNASANDQMLRSLDSNDLALLFKEFHSDVVGLLKNTRKDAVIWNDIIDIEPVEKFAFGNVVLMGDAAHATTPNMGQGACMAIEDAVILANCMDRAEFVEEAFETFEGKRIARTTKIVNDSWQIGKMAQISNPILGGLRNLLFRIMPASVADRSFKFIYDINFQ